MKHVNKIGKDGRLVLESSVENEVPGLVPLLAQLSGLDDSVDRAYFCHPSVQHCYKRKSHSGFCGYLNIQMQISYIRGAQAPGHQKFVRRIPGILDIQEMIELAWDRGICDLGRLQTGGVRNTRKWIGTPEVRMTLLEQSHNCILETDCPLPYSRCTDVRYANLLQASTIYESLAIRHHSNVFHDRKDCRAYCQVYDFVEDYFSKDQPAIGRIRMTQRAPIYFQQPGHSLTIVGFECHKNGSRNLIVFDPAFGPAKDVRRLIGKRDVKYRIPGRDREKLLRAYRRTSAQIAKYDSFETLT